MKQQLPISFEFFPPKTVEARAQFLENMPQFLAWQPKFVSMTHGAGGHQVIDSTEEWVTLLKTQWAVDVAPHVTCFEETAEHLMALLTRYQALGVKRLVALRGDGVSSSPATLQSAAELVQLIKEVHGDAFHVSVAAYPEVHPRAVGAVQDLEHFQEKITAGANQAITQYFFHAESYYQFRESCAQSGIHVPIVPGILPIMGFNQLINFSEKCGAEVPRWLKMRLQDLANDEASLRAFGVDITARLCEQLAQMGAPALHFYTLNRLQPLGSLLAALGRVACQ